MIFFVYGTDSYRCQEKLKELQDGFTQKRDSSGLNSIVLDGEKLIIEQFKQEVLATPFLGDKKMIIVKNIFSNKKISKELVAFLKEHENKIDNIVCFYHVFDSEKIKLTGNKIVLADALFKFLTQQKFIWEFNNLSPHELTSWLTTFTNNEKISIKPEAIKELAVLVGNDTRGLVMELQKLKAYKKLEAVTVADVRLLVKAKYDQNIFTLIDAISQKNARLALKLISDQLNSGNHELALLKMISRQFKIILRAKTGGTATSMGVHPFVFKKSKMQSENFSLEALTQIYKELIDMERQLKRGHKNPELLLDTFIATHCRE